eukprot:m.10378 g.10378  ORF g.10378 m.10378 type:complete len:265 (-) comp3661_c0_seq2:80-874(-)
MTQPLKETKDIFSQLADTVEEMKKIQTNLIHQTQAVKKARNSGTEVKNSGKRAYESHQQFNAKLAKFAGLLSGCKRSLNIIAEKKAAKGKSVASIQPPPSQSEMIDSLDTTLPTWPTLRPIPLCGSLPFTSKDQLTIGQEVAARVDSDWILSVITRTRLKDNKCWVADILRAPSEQDKCHLIAKEEIIPLPRWEPRSDFSRAFFSEGDKVLALYPRTTCFYEATVHRPPSKANHKYLLFFKDDSTPTRTYEVPIKYVLNAINVV